MKNLNKMKKSKILLALMLLSMMSPMMRANEKIETSEKVDVVTSSDENISGGSDTFSDEDLELFGDDMYGEKCDMSVSDENIFQVHDELVKYANKRRSAITPVLRKFYRMQEEIIAAENQPSKKEILIGSLKVLAKKYLPKFLLKSALSYFGWEVARKCYKRVFYGIPFFISNEEKKLNKYLDKMVLDSVGDMSKKCTVSMKPIGVDGTVVEFEDDEVIRSVYVPEDLTLTERQQYSKSYVEPKPEDNKIDLDGVKNAVIFVGKGRKVTISNINSLNRLLIFCAKETKVTFEGTTNGLKHLGLSSSGTFEAVNLPRSDTYVIKCKELKVAKDSCSSACSLFGLNSWTSSGRRYAIKRLGGIVDEEASIYGYIGENKTMYICNPIQSSNS